MKRMQQTTANKQNAIQNFGLVDFYPWAGIVGIATYLFVECFLE